MNPSLVRGFVLWSRRRGHAEGTIRADRSRAKRFGEYLDSVGIQDARQVTAQVVSGFQADLMKRPTRYGRPLGTGARAQMLSWLKKFFFYLLESGHILVDPTRSVRLPRTGRRLPRAVLTALEMRRLLEAPDVRTPQGLRDRALLEVLYGTGLRFSEMADLEVGQVDLEEKVLWVRRGKGRRDRVLPLGRWAAHWLSRHLEESQADRRLHRTDRVFFTVRGLRLHDYVMNELLRTYAIRAGISRHITLHTIRHTFATLLLKGGADLREIQKLLGHISLTTTTLYTHLDLEDLRRVQLRCHPRERLHRSRKPC